MWNTRLGRRACARRKDGLMEILRVNNARRVAEKPFTSRRVFGNAICEIKILTARSRSWRALFTPIYARRSCVHCANTNTALVRCYFNLYDRENA